MKYRILFLIVFLISAYSAPSQILTRYYEKGNVPDSIRERMFRTKSAHILIQPPTDIQELLIEDSLRSLKHRYAPVHFGKGIDVSFSLEDGSWTEVENGRIWAITFSSEGAKSLNFIFKSLSLPPGGTLEIVNKDGSVVYGPVTNGSISRKGCLLSDVIKGDEVSIYLFEPAAYLGLSSLIISRVVYGYRDTLGCNGSGVGGASNSCNIDVACFPEYTQESNAVARALVEGATSYCSGALVMTTDSSFKPYFLTAFHCIDMDEDGVLTAAEKEAVENWAFVFHYKKDGCYLNTMSNALSYFGAIFRAAWKDSDFALVEIDPQLGDIVDAPSFMWLGWDRTGNTPTGGACLHHPCGDYMKISISDYNFISTNYNGLGAGNFWKVNFGIGILQIYSSGAPILDQNNRVVGQLNGGHTNGDPCDWNEGWFGKFSKSWIGGGSDSTRLSNWLDPIGTNQLTTNSSSPLMTMSITGSTFPGSSSTYSVANLISRYSVAWHYTGTTIVSSDTLTTSNGQFIINNQRKQYINGTLYAYIYYQGSLVRTLSKPIRSGANFSGTYSQFGGWTQNQMGNPVFYEPIPSTNFGDNDRIYIHRGLMAEFTSPYFSNAIVTDEYGFPISGLTLWGNTYEYTFPTSGNPSSFTAIGRFANSYDVFKFKVERMLDYPMPPLNLLTSNTDGSLVITLSTGDEQFDYSDFSWNITIAHLVTGKTVFSGDVCGRSKKVSTEDWPAGIYVVSAQVGEETYTDKIFIR